MRFQLFLDTKDAELFRKATSELGTIFYRQINGDNLKEPTQWEMVYFSGSRIARFKGSANEKLVQLVKACGYEVDIIEIDEFSGTLKIIQKKEIE